MMANDRARVSAGQRQPPRVAGQRQPPRVAGQRQPPRVAGQRQPPRVAGQRQPPRVAGQRQRPRVAVVGGGAAGLYCAWRLARTGRLRVDLFEASPERLGGRVLTVRSPDGVPLDMGAGRFGDERTHPLVNALARRLEVPWRSLGAPSPRPAALARAFALARRLAARLPSARLRGVTLRRLLLEDGGMPPSLVDRAAVEHGYDATFDLASAADVIDALGPGGDFAPREFRTFVGGMAALTDALAGAARAAGVRVHLGSRATAWDAPRGSLTVADGAGSHRRREFDAAVFALPRSALLEVEGLARGGRTSVALPRLGEALESLSCAVPLLRAYARYPRAPDFVLRHHRRRITTATHLRQIIPLSSDGTLVMSAYADGDHARALHRLLLPDGNGKAPPREAKAVALAAAYARLVPRLRAPAPLWVETRFWREGVHVWRPSAAVGPRQRRRMLEEQPDRAAAPTYVCGESVADRHQGWVEAALRSADRVARRAIRDARV